ncbi:MAG: hypothetical protein JRN52_02025 [Nitrososphaerota archaeon]|nr:hypothetical protein [Nitrososphaerota archaeon]
MKLFDMNQRLKFGKVLEEVGVAVIWLSLGVVIANFLISATMNSPLQISIASAIFSVILILILGLRAAYGEIKSEALANELALSMKQSRWNNRRSNLRKKKNGK